jgi:hypothetical protein
VISGTPSSIIPKTRVKITASNSGGSTTVELFLTVTAAAPASIIYPLVTASYTFNEAIAPNKPTIEGGVASEFSIRPPLPPGLEFDIGTGLISGTPLVLADEEIFTVTASNSGGEVPPPSCH